MERGILTRTGSGFFGGGGLESPPSGFTEREG
jgi:hypothetical protein